METLSDVMLWRGIPEQIRSDYGPEFLAQELRQWLGNLGTGTLYRIDRSHLHGAHRQSVAQFRSRSGILLLASGGTGCFRAVICQVKPSSRIEQDFSFRFRQPQPSGNPIQSLDILRLSRLAQHICKRLSVSGTYPAMSDANRRIFSLSNAPQTRIRCRNLSQRA